MGLSYVLGFVCHEYRGKYPFCWGKMTLTTLNNAFNGIEMTLIQPYLGYRAMRIITHFVPNRSWLYVVHSFVVIYLCYEFAGYASEPRTGDF